MLEDLATSAAACAAGKLLLADMRPPALYAADQGVCAVVDPAGPGQTHYFSDPACTREIAFRPASYSGYCDEITAPGRANTRLGNAASWTADEGQVNDPMPGTPSRKWTVSYGTRLALSSELLDGKSVPFMKRLRYRDVQHAGNTKGTCALEMRVYKKDANASGLTPLLAFHGGGWRYRGGAFVGFEAQLAHYTEDGFVVFVPFYRLAGDADGNRECNEAPWHGITADAAAALDWVKRHAAAFGAKPGPPALMGQSAGAHLAGWLLTHHSGEVAAGLLFYGPSDMRDFLAQALPAGGLYQQRFSASLRTLSGFFGSDVRTIDLAANDDFVRLNSYHDYVRTGGVPPVFMIHGMIDAVVPSNQSVLMCNAYGGNARDDGGGARRRASYACGQGFLHLFQQGGHGLDGCLRRGMLDACAAGDEVSRKLLVDSLRQARAWLRERVDVATR